MTMQGYNQPTEIPRELDKWSWGAFFLNWIWGLGNGTYIALLMWVPLVNIIMIIILGARGNAWAWKNRPWRDVDHFKRVQKAWALWGLASWVLVIGGFVALFFSIFGILKSSEPYQAALAAVRADTAVVEMLGDNIKDGPLPSGSLSTNLTGGTAQFVFTVEGSRNSATVTTRSVRENGIWQMRYLAVTPKGGETIVLVDEYGVSSGGKIGA